MHCAALPTGRHFAKLRRSIAAATPGSGAKQGEHADNVHTLRPQCVSIMEGQIALGAQQAPSSCRRPTGVNGCSCCILVWQHTSVLLLSDRERARQGHGPHVTHQPDVVTAPFPVPEGVGLLQPLLHLQEHLCGMTDPRACTDTQALGLRTTCLLGLGQKEERRPYQAKSQTRDSAAHEALSNTHRQAHATRDGLPNLHGGQLLRALQWHADVSKRGQG